MTLSSCSGIALLVTVHLIVACDHVAEAMTLVGDSWRCQPVLPVLMERSDLLQTVLFLGCSVLVPEAAAASAATESPSAFHRSSASSVKQKVRLNIQTNHGRKRTSVDD